MPERRGRAFELYEAGTALANAMAKLGMLRSTAVDHLVQDITAARLADVSAWVADDVYRVVTAAAAGRDKLKPILDACGGRLPYADTKVALAHHAATGNAG